MDIRSLEKISQSARVLAMDAIQAANSGHPGLPLGCAELGAFLYGQALRHDPSDPSWLDRDRFVLSAGHGSMFLYAHLHLAGYPISLDDIKSFRKVGSKCAGHPEFGAAPGIETTTGPLGQGLAMAVGMAIAESMLAARFNTAKRTIFDHYTYALAGDGCLMEGVSGEASSLAGHLKLGKLIVFYDSNRITIDGSTELAFSEDSAKRYEAYGWQVLQGDMYDFEGLEALVAQAKRDTERPSLIVLKSVIGKGAPTKQGTAGVHGAPLGAEELAKAKAAIGAPAEPAYWVAPEAYAFYEKRRGELAKVNAAWKAEYAAWRAEEPALAAELDAALAHKATKELDLPAFAKGDKVATRNASGKAIAAVNKAYPSFVGGSADLTGPNVTAIVEGGDYSPKNRSGRYLHFGIREFAMAAISNGISVHGGFHPFVATFLVFADYLRPALRLSALMHQPVIYVLTHDSIFVGEDGPTHQPIETLASLRAIPNVRVLRPADAEETQVAWKMAMERLDGPTVIALSRQNLPILEKADPDWAHSMALGAYVVRNTAAQPKTVIVATGSELALAISAADKAGDPGIRIVSMPSRELFLAQPKPIREAILPAGARVFVAEAGVAQGWEALAKPEDIFSIQRFGESGPGDEVAKHLGFTADAFAEKLKAASKN